jgi:hypothetical protein
MRTREENRIYMRNWRKGNPAKPKERTRESNRKAYEYQRQWRRDHPERVREYYRRYRAANPRTYKSGVPFRLTIANIMNGVFTL